MQKILLLSNRQLQAYFYGPLGYWVLAVFSSFTAIIFSFLTLIPGNLVQFHFVLLYTAVPGLATVVPWLTMMLVSHEVGRGTIEPLMTAPVTDTQVILGKFFGAAAFYFVLLGLTLLFIALLALFGNVDTGQIFAGYVGVVLAGALYIALGLLISTCTSHWFVSLVLTQVILGAMSFVPGILGFTIHHGWIHDAMLYMDVRERCRRFCNGVIALDDVVFFASLTALALFLSVKILESRKWRA